MKEIFTFYKALDPVQGSWDGYGYFPINDRDFLAFVADAPSGASIHTPEHIKQFWQEFAGNHVSSGFHEIELADALNRLQNQLQQKGRQENILYQATLSIVRKLNDKLFYCCIGDSALQILRGEKLFRLSETEIWDSSLIAQSNQTGKERQKTRENRFIGSNGSFIQTMEICQLNLKDHDTLLLYTDGIEDLLTPGRMLTVFAESNDEIRNSMDSIFLPDRVKDDATLIAIPIRIPLVIPVEKELANLRNQLEQIRKDQTELRKNFLDLGTVRTRLDKMESSLREVSQTAQRSDKRPMAAGSGVSSRKQPPLPWLIAVLCLLLGTAVGALLFQRAKPRRAENPVQTKPVPKRTVTPPEIPPEQDCSYTIQKGDSLEKIAASKSMSIEQLLKLNPTHKRDAALKVGQTIQVCRGDSI
jgi:serine/threonine protein phosphatase PrpC/LysM repeat protein